MSDTDASDNDIGSHSDEQFPIPVLEVNEEWLNKMPRKRTRQRDMVIETPGTTASSAHVRSFSDAFSLFFTNQMKEIITRYKQARILRHDNWKAVTVRELDSFIGVLIAMGANNDNKIQSNDLWAQDSHFHSPR